jgi:hypothetical protein
MTTNKTVKTTKAELLAKIEEAAVVIEKLTRKLAAAKPAAKATAKTKPRSRSGRLIEAEAEVKAAKPKDPRKVWRDMQ